MAKKKPGKRTDPTGRNRRLTCGIEHGQVVVRIGVETLAFAANHSEYDHAFVKFDEKAGEYRRQHKVVDAVEFARDVVRQMEHEEEDGSSPISDLLDKACVDALYDGSLGTTECDEKV